MFFTEAEKQNNGFIDGWSTRYLAFDTNRRYLYYSERIKKEVSSPDAGASSRGAPEPTAQTPQPSRRSASALPSQVEHSTWEGAGAAAATLTAPRAKPKRRSTWSSVPNTPHLTGSPESSSPFTHVGSTDSPSRQRTPQPRHSHAHTELYGASPPLRPPEVLPEAPLHANLSSSLPAAENVVLSEDPSILHSSGAPEGELETLSTIRRVRWKGKFKVSTIFPHALHRIIVSPQHLYQIDITGVSRPLAAGELPGLPLLCSSAGLHYTPTPFAELTREERELRFRDVYQLQDLSEAIRTNCFERWRERDLASARRQMSGEPNPQESPTPLYGTLRSPIKRSEYLSLNAEKQHSFRFLSEYEYIRFLAVLMIVMGYDELGVSPFQGFSPIDPRNGIAFSPLPACAAYPLHKLEVCMPYVYVFGSLVGYDSSRRLQIQLKNAWLVITNDMVFVSRESGVAPTWAHQNAIHSCCFNAECHRPYIALLTDSGTPDLIFSPELRSMGTYLRDFPFHKGTAVEQCYHILYRCCHANVAPRRVITFQARPEKSIRDFVLALEQERGSDHPLELTLRIHQQPEVACPIVPLELRRVYLSVYTAQTSLDVHAVHHAGLPLYDTTSAISGLHPLTAEQLGMIRQLLAQHQLEGELVGIDLEGLASLGECPNDPAACEAFLLRLIRSRQANDVVDLVLVSLLNSPFDEPLRFHEQGERRGEEEESEEVEAEEKQKTSHPRGVLQRSTDDPKYVIPGATYLPRPAKEGSEKSAKSTKKR